MEQDFSNEKEWKEWQRGFRTGFMVEARTLNRGETLLKVIISGIGLYLGLKGIMWMIAVLGDREVGEGEGVVVGGDD